MKEVLVVFFSRSGNTERVALMLAEQLDADVERIEEKKRSSFLAAGRQSLFKKQTAIATPVKNPANYKLVVIGTPIWAWNIIPPVRSYLSVQKNFIRNAAFFTSAGSTGSEKIVAGMEELIGRKAIGSIAFLDAEYKTGGEAALKGKIVQFASLLREQMKKADS